MHLCSIPRTLSRPLATCMNYSSSKMVCETKIVAEDHNSIPGSTQKDAQIVSSSQMWPLMPAAAPVSSSFVAAEEEDARTKDRVYIREFQPSDQEVARRIYEGILERIPSTAFRGLKHEPLIQILYALLIGKRTPIRERQYFRCMDETQGQEPVIPNISDARLSPSALVCMVVSTFYVSMFSNEGP